MAGNSSRRGATRKAGSKKVASAGTGGKNRRALEGRGPTPKAEDREYHPAHKAKIAAERRAVAGTRGTSGRQQASASRSAAGSKGGRKSSTHEIVSGRNSVVEALRAGIPVSTVYIASRLEADDRTREIISVAGNSNYPLLEVSRAELDRLTDGSVHQGVAIQVPPYAYADDEALLAPPEAAAKGRLIFAPHGVLVPERRAAGVTASAWKVSAGAAARVPVARVTNLTRTLQAYKQAGAFVVGLDGGGDVAIADLPYATDPLVLVVGSEGKGLSRLVREQCDAIASIPIASAVESLNAGVAAGIALYEVSRQRAS